jgi:hypothetical protein
MEEIRAYYDVPEAFRRSAIAQLGSGISRMIDASRSLRRLALPPDLAGIALDDEEQQLTTIFPFTIQRDGSSLSLNECKEIYRKLRTHDCLVRQPVGWNNGAAAALRILHQRPSRHRSLDTGSGRVSGGVAAGGFGQPKSEGHDRSRRPDRRENRLHARRLDRSAVAAYSGIMLRANRPCFRPALRRSFCDPSVRHRP